MTACSEEDYQAATKLKEEGNDHFKNGDMKKALKCYTKIFMYVGMNSSMNVASMMAVSGAPQKDLNDNKSEFNKKVDDLRLTAFGNIAAVYMKTENWEEVKEKCTRILSADKENFKALFRRGMAYRKQGLYELANTDLNQALEIGKKQNQDEKFLVPIRNELEIVKKMSKRDEKEFLSHLAKGLQRQAKKSNKGKQDTTATTTTTDSNTNTNTNTNTSESTNDTTTQNNTNNNENTQTKQDEESDQPTQF